MEEFAIIKKYRERFKLNLKGLNVFTESATGPFKWTPIIALLAGADRVFAIARDSGYGSADESISEVRAAIGQLDFPGNLEFVSNHDSLAVSDIVTNLGFVRPLNAERIQLMKPTAVIPLMWETWEFRVSDLELAACLERGILVLGTNERRLNTFDYVGKLASALIKEKSLEIKDRKVIVLGAGEFGKSISEYFFQQGAVVGILARKRIELIDETLILSLDINENRTRNFIRQADVAVIADHHEEKEVVGLKEGLPLEEFWDLNPNLKWIHITGLINKNEFIEMGFELYPHNIPSKPRTMSVTTAYLGPDPIIELHSAGLKVGEEMAKARKKMNIDDARKVSLQNRLCQDFDEGQIETILQTREFVHE